MIALASLNLNDVEKMNRLYCLKWCEIIPKIL